MALHYLNWKGCAGSNSKSIKMLLIVFRKNLPSTLSRVKSWAFKIVFQLKLIKGFLRTIFALNGLLDTPTEAITPVLWKKCFFGLDDDIYYLLLSTSGQNV